MDLYVRGPHFRIEKDHPNFNSTHLKKTCYANSDEKHELPVEELGRYLGRLEAQLLREFQVWYS